jgi:D-glutamate cyclase
MMPQPEDQDELAAGASLLVEDCVGENLDQLCTLDMRGDAVLRVLHGAARRLYSSPLSMTAARALMRRVGDGERVLMLTGFLSPKPFPETDGLIGSAVLAAALERACGALPVFVAEPEVSGPLLAGLRAAGLNSTQDLSSLGRAPHAAAVLSFSAGGREAESVSAALADQIRPAACLAIERPGANPEGQYHLALGRNVTADIAPLDLLYREAAAQGALTIGIGDFGNELGVGAIYDVIRAETPAGADCGCGCGGGTACAIPADVTVLASVSDWGAYAVAACLAYLKRDPSVLASADVYRRVCEETVRSGAIDGPTRYAVPALDGIDHSFNAALLEVMRGAFVYPAGRPSHSAIRLFRAARMQAGG